MTEASYEIDPITRPEPVEWEWRPEQEPSSPFEE